MERQFSVLHNQVLFAVFKFTYAGYGKGQVMITQYKTEDQGGSVPFPVVVPDKAWVHDFQHPAFNTIDEMRAWDTEFVNNESPLWSVLSPAILHIVYGHVPFHNRYVVMVNGACAGVANITMTAPDNNELQLLSLQDQSADITLKPVNTDTDSSFVLLKLMYQISQRLPENSQLTFVAVR